MIQVILVLGILLSTIQIDLAIPASGKCGYHIISVIPSPDAPCNETELQCLTLSQLANSSSDYIGENTTLHFLPGEHSLDSTLLIKNSDSLYASSLDSNVTIACSHSSASFEFSNMSVVHISGLTFTGCTGNKFINITQLTLEDSKFIGNKDSNINSPALELIGSSAKLIRTELSHNYGSRVTSLLCENGDNRDARNDFLYGWNRNDNIEVSATAGGAIVSTHSNVTIDGSVFEGNSAQAGGAIFAEQQSNITITNSTFVGNQATALQSHQYCYFGGVLYNGDHEYFSVIIANNTFTDNSAYDGGVLGMSRAVFAVISVTHSEFTNNSASQDGGVLCTYAEHSNITITHSEFTNNNANQGGGVLRISDDHSNITITHSEFTDNSANQNGGVLCTSAGHSNVTITHSEFANNNANQIGGVLYTAGHSNIAITNSEFTDNSANQNGGVLCTSAGHSNVTITHSEFTNNNANQGGGVLHLFFLYVNSYITITHSEFTNNSANQDGGVLYLRLDFIYHSLTNILTITNSNFTNNSANRDGGVLFYVSFAYADDVSIVACTFVDNKADGAGGALKMRYATDMSVTQSNFSDNKASEGGAMHIMYVRDLVIHYSQFHHNVANFGGVLYVRNSPTTITGANFSHNIADNNGGTMYTEGEKTSITDCKFDHNTAGNDGGVIWAEQATINASRVNINFNHAYGDGGVLYAQNSPTTIIGANFSHNKADNNGGMMYTEGERTSIADCKFDHNTAGNDGGVIRSYQSTIDISESEYSSNSANNEGGVFHIDQTNLSIHQTSFVYSKANDGGVIWIDQSDLMINHSSFGDNNASAGGVIWAEQAKLNAIRVTITGNHANIGVVYLLESTSDWSAILYTDNIGSLYVCGGAINIRNNSKLINNIQPSMRHPVLKEGGTITAFQCEIRFEGNSLLIKGCAERGGALKAIESKIHVYGNVTIANNNATEAGGGIYLYHSELICWKNSALNISSNTAAEKGGGISATGSVIKVKNPHFDLAFSNLHFDSNQAANGGGIFLEMDSKVYILKSKINASKAVISNQRLITFSLNSAQYGGAIYVSDNNICSVSTKSTVNECFIQMLAMYAPVSIQIDPDDIRCQNMAFVNNSAEVSGNSLFGGLLDKCTVSQFAETNINNVTWTTPFQMVH